MRKPSALLQVVRALTSRLVSPGQPHTYSQRVPAPKGLSSCAPSDRLAVRMARLAAKSGGELVGCFKSEKTFWYQGLTVVPFELAIATDLPGASTSADLDKLWSTSIEQWKGFESLSKESENYTVRLNELIKGAGRSGGIVKLGSSFKPVLVSIGRIGAKSFSVVSIRSYVMDQDGIGIWLNAAHLPFMIGPRNILKKVTATANVLGGSRLVRLDIQRVLTDPSDVAQVQSEIAEWANAVSALFVTPTVGAISGRNRLPPTSSLPEKF